MSLSLESIRVYAQLSITGDLTDQTRLQIISSAARNYLELRGDDHTYTLLQQATSLANEKSWQSFYTVVKEALLGLQLLEPNTETEG